MPRKITKKAEVAPEIEEQEVEPEVDEEYEVEGVETETDYNDVTFEDGYTPDAKVSQNLDVLVPIRRAQEKVMTGYHEYKNTIGQIILRDGRQIKPGEVFVARPADLSKAIQKAIVVLETDVPVEFTQADE